MPWTEQPLAFLDFEGSLASGILEYGIVNLCGGRITSVQTRLCSAIGAVRAEDSAVHGLRAESLAGLAPFSADWALFAELRERGPLAAHYAGVENALLKSVWPYPRPSPDFARPGARIIDWGPWIDSARLYAQFYPGLASGRLDAVVAACGLQAELDAVAQVHCPLDRRFYHAALYDALAGALLLLHLARQPRVAELTMTQLMALSTLDPGKREAIMQRELFQAEWQPQTAPSIPRAGIPPATRP